MNYLPPRPRVQPLLCPLLSLTVPPPPRRRSPLRWRVWLPLDILRANHARGKRTSKDEMPEDPPGDASGEVVSKFCVGVVFPGRVLLWRTPGESGSCLGFLWVNCLTFCLFNVIQSKAARQSAGRFLASTCEAGYAF